MPALKTKPARKDAAAAGERLRRAALALRVGTPQRQIARELECDEATIRRDRDKIEQLDSAQLEAILHGAPAEPLLKAARKEPGAAVQPGRPKQSTVDAMVDLVFRCLEEKRTRIERTLTPGVGFESVELKLQLVPADQERVWQEVIRQANRLVIPPGRRGIAINIVERCRPRPDPDLQDGMHNLINWHTEWLLRWLPLVAPDQATLDAAIAAARARVEREHRSAPDTPFPKPRRKRAKQTGSKHMTYRYSARRCATGSSVGVQKIAGIVAIRLRRKSGTH